MSHVLPGPAARLPLRIAAVLTALASVLLTFGFGIPDGPRPALAAQPPAVGAPAAPGPSVPGPATPDGPGPAAPDPAADPGTHSSDARPHTDDCTARTVPFRPQRDAGERTVPAGHLLFTPEHTPRVPPRPARPAPAAGHAPPAAAHMPADLGRAPPVSSSA
ncbi:hypothetical protein WJ438_04950 [Streptomyces sp. GD-15H]|uniref:hypothetical protein n=1 Tax=Streptomyces sp. GD-15H TaxID=3129112 RepID=UPI00324FE890